MNETPRSEGEEILARLESIERRLARLETRLPAPRPDERAAPYSAAAPPVKPAPAVMSAARPEPPPPLTAPATEAEVSARKRVEELFGDKGAPPPFVKVELGVEAPTVVKPEGPKSSLGSAERFVGTKLLGAIGAIVLLVGVAFALKVAFDKGYITPAMRVALGTLTGCALFAGAEVLLRRRLGVFAAVVAGGGIGILTLTNWAAHVLYGFTSFTLGFGLGCGITVLGFGWSVVRAQFSTLLLAIVSGYLTPVLISKSSHHPWGISLYLAALAIAAAAAGAHRQWRTPVLLAIPGSMILLTGWYAGARVHSLEVEAQRRVYLEIAICAAGLALTIVGDFAVRALKKRVLGLWETAGLAVLLLWTAMMLTMAHHEEASPEGIGALYLILAASLGGVCVKAVAASRAFRGAALTFAILGVTLAIGCFFEGATRALAYAAWAAALALLEARLRSVIPLLGCLLNHALVAIWVGSLGEIPENAAFLWSERSTVLAVEALALWATSRALRTAGGPHAAIGRLAMAAMQVFIGFLLLASLPASRVALAWAGQALALALIALRTRPAAGAEGARMDLDFAFLCQFGLAAAAVRVLERHGIDVSAESTPFVNLRVAFFGVASAALLVNSTVLRGAGEAGPLVAYLTRILGFGAAAVGLATECAFLLSRAYGSRPPILHGSVDMDGGLYSVFWNARFVFLAVAAGVVAAGVLLQRRRPEPSEGDAALVRGVFLGLATIGAHLTLLLGLTLEAMGLADPRVGAHPDASADLIRASNVQTAVSLALGLYSALVLAAGFRRSRVHRLFGLTGLLATVVKVLVVDLDGVDLEWRMLIFLGLGALLLAGAYLYARAVRRGD